MKSVNMNKYYTLYNTKKYDITIFNATRTKYEQRNTFCEIKMKESFRLDNIIRLTNLYTRRRKKIWILDIATIEGGGVIF